MNINMLSLKLKTALRLFKIFLIAIQLCFSPFIFNGLLFAQDVQKLLSPDKKFTANIIPLLKEPEATQEHKIEIRSASGKLLYEKDYGSEDGEHGFGVVHAAWTSDSKFFVYSMTSSGGHQAWHFPTEFYSVDDKIIYSLDEFLGPITDPDFELHDPDIVNVVGQSYPNLEETQFEKSLFQLVKGRKK